MNALQQLTWTPDGEHDLLTCPCGQPLERRAGQTHCPRCGVTLQVADVRHRL